jgi:hypothetical protein
MNDEVRQARREELKESQAAVSAGLKPSKKDRKAARALAFKARMMAVSAIILATWRLVKTEPNC